MKTKYNLNNNDLTLAQKGQKVNLKGWIARKRNLGFKIFFLLRDVSGVIQLVVENSHSQYKEITLVTIETVVDIKGIVVERINKNLNLKTGEIEILVTEWNVLSPSQKLPLNIYEQSKALEEHRLKYRYLDLRRSKQKQYLIQRHNITQNIRQTLLKNNFFELETPLLCKSTPEGARDYLVPSRLHLKHFYALPQSPQIFKQLYMIAGFERYFQIAKCFRDEDLRADRQPEFTQIDIEASFFSQEDIMTLTEEIIVNLFLTIFKKNLKTPFIRIPFEKAMLLYGTDKPDLRFELMIENISQFFKLELIQQKNYSPKIRGVKVNVKQNKNILNRKKIENYQKIIQIQYKLELSFLKKQNQILKGNLSAFIQDDTFLEEGEYFFLIIDYVNKYDEINVLKALGFLRIQLGQDLHLINEEQEFLLWVIDFPLFEFNQQEQKYYALHHPFTTTSDIYLLEKEPVKVKAQAYDLVWNGYEVGGGSLRNYQFQIQKMIFEKLGFSSDEMKKCFGFFIEALQYGTPPHGGIALGLDRLVMLFTKTNNIKDVIAFPKTQSAQDLMLETPSEVEENQLDILKLKYVIN